MNTRVTSLIEEARNLTPDEREELILRLQFEFEKEDTDGTPEELEGELLAEVERRITAFERGETTSRSHDEVMADIWRMLAKT